MSEQEFESAPGRAEAMLTPTIAQELDVRLVADAESVLAEVKEGIAKRIAAGERLHMELIAFAMRSPYGTELSAPALTGIAWLTGQIDTLATSRYMLEMLDAIGCVLVMPSVVWSGKGDSKPPRVIVARLEHRKVERCFVASLTDGAIGEWRDVTGDATERIGPYARLLPLLN